MAVTLAVLRAAVAAFMHRSEASFVENTRDNLLLSINLAKNYAQRAIDFECARDCGEVSVATATTFGLLDDMKVVGSSTAMAVKSVQKAYYQDPAATWYPISIIGRANYAQKSQRVNDTYQLTSTMPQTPPPSSLTRRSLVMFGRKFYVSPASNEVWTSPFKIGFDVVTWVADFVNTTDTSFLLDYCFDYLLFRSIYQLNFFLKEDERVPITEAVLKDCWNNVVQWNATMVGNITDDNTLD